MTQINLALRKSRDDSTLFPGFKLHNWHLHIYIASIVLCIFWTLYNQRSYQDSWVLEDIVPVVIILTVSFVIVANYERRSSYLAICTSTFQIILRLIPGLKYVWIYGTAIDQSVHFNSVTHLINTGFPLDSTPYTNVPGLHTVFGAIVLASGINVNEVMKYSFPIIMGLMPLLIYFLSGHIRINRPLRNQIIITSAFTFDPYFLSILGTSFGTLFIAIIAIWFLARQANHFSSHMALTSGIILSMLGLTFSHAVSSFVFPFLLAAIFIPQVFISRLQLKTASQKGVSETKRLIILSLVILLTWWMFQARGVFALFVKQIWSLLSYSGIEKPPVPNRLFELPFQDALIVLWVMHSNTIMVTSLSLLGVILLWKNRAKISTDSQTILFTLFCLEIGIALILFGQIAMGSGNLEYFRLIGYAVSLSPFFIGATLWCLHQRSRQLWATTLTAILIGSFIQVFPYQPMLPSGNVLFQEIDDDEPIMYLHTVLTEYQLTMLTFVQEHQIKNNNTIVLSDRVTKDSAYRIWGQDYFDKNPIRYPAKINDAFDHGNWDLLLIHRPGIAGPFSEPVEIRSRKAIDKITLNPQYSLIYDNGESVVLMK